MEREIDSRRFTIVVGIRSNHKAKAIQATLFNTAARLRAQKDGFVKLTSAGDYGRQDQATTGEDRPLRARQHEGLGFLSRQARRAIKYSIDILKLKDRDMAAASYDEEVRLTVRDGTSDAKILQPMIDEMKAATKAQRDLKINDLFAFSFVRKANEELKASGWKP